jgi:malate dehydrogenase (oxaloacetate-decarboxylating)
MINAGTVEVPPALHRMDLLDKPSWNKGTAFDDHERAVLGLRGLLLPRVESLAEQSGRAYRAYQTKRTDLGRHLFLRQLQDSNETLFYRLLLDHIEEMMPIVYTPTVGLACQQFSQIYRRPRGLFVAYPSRDAIERLNDPEYLGWRHERVGGHRGGRLPSDGDGGRRPLGTGSLRAVLDHR